MRGGGERAGGEERRATRRWRTPRPSRYPRSRPNNLSPRFSIFPAAPRDGEERRVPVSLLILASFIMHGESFFSGERCERLRARKFVRPVARGRRSFPSARSSGSLILGAEERKIPRCRGKEGKSGKPGYTMYVGNYSYMIIDKMVASAIVQLLSAFINQATLSLP
jgi:hypothetical protein